VARTSVGLDIGTRTVHVAEVAGGRGGPAVTNFGGVALPDTTVREGEVIDPVGVADAIRELVGAAKLKQKKVNLGVANQRVVVRQIDLPWMEEAELRSSLPFQVQEFIPIPVEDAQLDYHVLKEIETDEGVRTLRILLVAAHKDMLAAHMEAARSAGLKPVGVDLNPFAQIRVLARDNALSGGPEALVDVGGGVTDIVVHEDTVPSFVRILVMGGDDITNALASGMGITHEEAEQLKQQSSDSADATPARIVDEHARQFVDEVRGSLDYFRTQVAPQAQVQRIVLTGGGALLRGVADRLGEATNLPVEVGNPFERFGSKKTAFSDAELAQVGPTLATAIGLALGGLA
jgi:type IV pilus assembly protein PilM